MLLVIIPAYKPDDTLIKLIGDLEPYDLERSLSTMGAGRNTNISSMRSKTGA